MRKAAKKTMKQEEKAKTNKSIISELKDLKTLLEDGVITEEEFINLKKKLIG